MSKIGEANGTFLGHLSQVVQGKRNLDWLRTKWTNEVNKDMVAANLKHWGLG